LTIRVLLSQVYVHLVFSTKGRAPMPGGTFAGDVHAYLGGIARNKGCQPHGIGGTADHVHLLIELGRSTSVADIVRDLKSNSSAWIHGRQQAFAWQSGYGAFSFGCGDLGALQRYVAGQEEHHRTMTFQEELRLDALRTRHGVGRAVRLGLKRCRPFRAFAARGWDPRLTPWAREDDAPSGLARRRPKTANPRPSRRSPNEAWRGTSGTSGTEGGAAPSGLSRRRRLGPKAHALG
jgi:REP element-mobilizing transposase RayT